MKKIDSECLKDLVLGRKNESHKREYGHALLVCGCSAMPGAAVLATGAALKSGCGLVTLHSTASAAVAAVSQFPSAMLSLDPADCFSSLPGGLSGYSCIGVGPGLGKAPMTALALEALFDNFTAPMVIDADALNLIAASPSLLEKIPRGSVLTPHLGELRRLLPGCPDFASGEPDANAVISEFCRKIGCVLVKKGYHTQVFSPNGEMFENTTGNPGMAKGGSGDVLTGLVTGLIARGYDSLSAAMLGVWIHGYAGDCLTEEFTAEAYNSRDLIDYLYRGFKVLI